MNTETYRERRRARTSFSTRGGRPPSVEDAISILRGLRERFELHHGVRIQDNALVSAVVLSNRYISDRFLPDKAIDLVDEACAMIRTEMESMPTELDELTAGSAAGDRRDRTKNSKKDQASKSRLETLRKELADTREKADALKRQWEREKASVDRVSKVREEIEKTRVAMETANALTILTKSRSCVTARCPSSKRTHRFGKIGRANPTLQRRSLGGRNRRDRLQWTGIR